VEYSVNHCNPLRLYSKSGIEQIPLSPREETSPVNSGVVADAMELRELKWQASGRQPGRKMARQAARQAAAARAQ